MTHPFDRFLHRHGYYPRKRTWRRTKKGKRKLGAVLHVMPGYVMIESRRRGSYIYLTTEEWLAFLKFGARTYKFMETPGYDVYQSIRQYDDAEQEHLKEMRRQKKSRYRR